MKRLFLFLLVGTVINTLAAQPFANQTEVMAWGNLTGIRIDGELIDFETSLMVGDSHSGKERYTTHYERQGDTQIVRTVIDRVSFVQQVTDVERGRCLLHLELASDTTRSLPAGLCLHLDAVRYADAKIKAGRRQVSVRLADREGVVRDIQLKLSRPVKTVVTRTSGEIRIAVPVMDVLRKGETQTLDMEWSVSGRIDHSPAAVHVDATQPGRLFVGMGGNFRLQNPSTDPAVIDYCLDNMRVAYGRVEMPWRDWQPDVNASFMETPPDGLPRHVRESMEMARRLAAKGMPVIVSCWFPPRWTLDRNSHRRSGGVAALRLDTGKEQQIIASLIDYLLYLKIHYGVEAAMFSFNESDIGIDVLHTADEHAAFIKAMGRALVERGLATKMLLGDTSDANPTAFILPALNDREAWPYIGAVSFHSWRGCNDEKLHTWADAARTLGVPLLVGEGSTDAAAWRYPQIFGESTFALYEINLYVRMLAICQPLSILQWQLTADYSLLKGGGVFGSQGVLTPTQRFWNIKQLAATPENSFALPVTGSKQTLNCAAFADVARGEYCVHMVNNGAACNAVVDGLPAKISKARVFVTNAGASMTESTVSVTNGTLSVSLPPLSFISLMMTTD
jgi:O-Glycosyl hydrolase